MIIIVPFSKVIKFTKGVQLKTSCAYNIYVPNLKKIVVITIFWSMKLKKSREAKEHILILILFLMSNNNAMSFRLLPYIDHKITITASLQNVDETCISQEKSFRFKNQIICLWVINQHDGSTIGMKLYLLFHVFVFCVCACHIYWSNFEKRKNAGEY